MTNLDMANLDKALADITAIRTQMARGAEFRGYGPATVAATGCVATKLVSVVHTGESRLVVLWSI